MKDFDAVYEWDYFLNDKLARGWTSGDFPEDKDNFRTPSN